MIEFDDKEYKYSDFKKKFLINLSNEKIEFIDKELSIVVKIDQVKYLYVSYQL